MKKKKKFVHTKTLYNTLSILGLIATVAACIYAYRLGLFTSTAALSAAINNVGIWGPLLFMVVQIIQVVIPIIPGGISCAAGVLIFGAGWGFVYNYIGIVIGSIIAFHMARRLGRTFLKSITSTKTYNKYIGWLDENRRFDKLFAIAIFLPISPDDFLCMLAGVTKMKVRTFIAILILCKPLSIFLYGTGLASVATWLL